MMSTPSVVIRSPATVAARLESDCESLTMKVTGCVTPSAVLMPSLTASFQRSTQYWSSAPNVASEPVSGVTKPILISRPVAAAAAAARSAWLLLLPHGGQAGEAAADAHDGAGRSGHLEEIASGELVVLITHAPSLRGLAALCGSPRRQKRAARAPYDPTRLSVGRSEPRSGLVSHGRRCLRPAGSPVGLRHPRAERGRIHHTDIISRDTGMIPSAPVLSSTAARRLRATPARLRLDRLAHLPISCPVATSSGDSLSRSTTSATAAGSTVQRAGHAHQPLHELGIGCGRLARLEQQCVFHAGARVAAHRQPDGRHGQVGPGHGDDLPARARRAARGPGRRAASDRPACRP